MAKCAGDGVHHGFYLINTCILNLKNLLTLDLYVSVDTLLKFIILGKVIIVVCLRLRSFVHFPRFKDRSGVCLCT